MSCIAGVGGKVKPLVKKAQSGRPIIVIDGCPLNCAKACLNNVDVEPDKHIVLTDYNLKKKFNSKLNPKYPNPLTNQYIFNSSWSINLK